MTSLVIGMGEVGTALFNILNAAYPKQVGSYDVKEEWVAPTTDIDILHICIPYSDNFHDIVLDYVHKIGPQVAIIIHSSVPVGATKQFVSHHYMHSPVRGVHPHMELGLITYIKYIGYNGQPDHLEAISDYFGDAGIPNKLIGNTDTTELMKLLELSRYGVYIAFAKEQEAICKHFKVNYEQAYLEYERSRNDGMVELEQRDLCQPVLYPFKDFVGGHCTVEDMEILLKQFDTPLLRKSFEIDRATKIWPNSNVYPTAKIGKGCSIGQFCEIGNMVRIGNNVRIGAFTFIPEGVDIGDDVFIAPRVSFSNDKHPPAGKEKWGKIKVEKGAVIGMGAIVLPGVTIGENAVIGAGAIVTKDVPAGEVWYGLCASSHGKREEVYD